MTRYASYSRQAGFTLMELIVSVIVLAQVLVAALVLFDANNKLARVQTQLAEMQQGLRISQYDVVREARMAGRGPVPLGSLPNGNAVAIRDDVQGAGALISTAYPLIKAVEHTDILQIRGVITTPIYQIDAADPASFSMTATDATIQVGSVSPRGIKQDLKALKDAIDGGPLKEPILLISNSSDEVYVVGELIGGNSGSDPLVVNVSFVGSPASDYAALSSGGAVNVLEKVAFLGILEEYRYFVREEFSVPGDNSTEPMPKLSRARFRPGTETGYGKDSTEQEKNVKSDLADNVIDFQVALGVDSDSDGSVADAEWIFSETTPTAPGAGIDGDLFYLRINTLVRTDRRDFQYQADDLTAIENRTVWTEENKRAEKMYRRRHLRTIVQLRNL